jgi:hypothetical protein
MARQQHEGWAALKLQMKLYNKRIEFNTTWKWLDNKWIQKNLIQHEGSILELKAEHWSCKCKQSFCFFPAPHGLCRWNFTYILDFPSILYCSVFLYCSCVEIQIPGGILEAMHEVVKSSKARIFNLVPLCHNKLWSPYSTVLVCPVSWSVKISFSLRHHRIIIIIIWQKQTH